MLNIYIYVCVCVFVCVYRKSASRFSRGTVLNALKQSRINIMRGKNDIYIYIHTHTYIYINAYMYSPYLKPEIRLKMTYGMKFNRKKK